MGTIMKLLLLIAALLLQVYTTSGAETTATKCIPGGPCAQSGTPCVALPVEKATCDKELTQAARFAASNANGGPYTDVSVEHYSTQVVAGINFLMDLKLGRDNAAPVAAKVRVFRSLQQKFELTSQEVHSAANGF